MDVCKPRCIIFLLVVLCWTATRTYGQTTDRLDRTLTLRNKTVRLDTLLQTVSRQAGIKFSYNSRRLNSSYRLKLSETSLTAREILDQLKRTTGVVYSVIENQVILNIEKSTVQKPVKAESVKPQPARSLSPPRDSVSQVVGEPSANSTTPIDSAKIPSQTIVNNAIITADSFRVIPATQTVIPAKSDSAQEKQAKPINTKIPPPEKQHYFIDLGVSAEETLFMGATLQGGFQKLFASVSLKSNGKSVIVLYGLGSALWITERSRILVSAQYGTYSKNFTYKEIEDDTVINTYKVGVKGAWIRGSIGREWKPNPKSNWKFYAGLNFNALESRYKVNGTRSGLENIPVSDPERKFSAFYPFYTLSNNYGDVVSTSMKTWIGVQAGISFTIFYR